MGDGDLHDRLVRRLTSQLGDRAAALQLAAQVEAAALTWRPPEVAMAGVDRIVAYAFGNRPGAGGEMEPGPINGLLADVVEALHRLRPVRIYAQWEIARHLEGRPGIADLVSIEPVRNPDGALVYLSTDGVAAQIVRMEGGDARAMGRVAVVGHADHARRCVQVSCAAGMDAAVAGDVALPDAYDPLSGQTWTRRRDIYLLHDLAAQFMRLRSETISESYPEG